MQSSSRPLKLRRRGRHAAPSPVEKIAGRATSAAPVVAIAGGVIIAGPTAASAATTTNATVSAPAAHGAAAASTTAGTARATLDAARSATGSAAGSSARTYAVRSGDTLSRISRQFYGTGSDWRYLYDQNTSVISNPNEIFPGQVLDVPSGAPRQAPAQAGTDTQASTDSEASTDSQASTGTQVSTNTASASVAAHVGGGTLGCSGLEALWEQAGGSPSEAHMAAEIAMAESGGNQYAHSPTNDYGYWQINGSHGAQATYDPVGNAEAAISISGDGTNWSPWSTYTSGAYQGRC